jgi:tetratricopeptide (TPR) repeat protein
MWTWFRWKKKPNPKRLHQQNERKLLKQISTYLNAGLVACFCFGSSLTQATAPNWIFDAELDAIYKLAINLQTDQARARLAKINDPQRELYKFYLQSFCESVEVLISEDEALFAAMEKSYKERLKILDGKPESADILFLKAEMALHRGFNMINLGQEFSAVFAIKQAYNLSTECLKKYPSFVPVKKTNGLLEVMVGSVPDKYDWFISLLGMKGSVAVGQKQLNDLRNSPVSLNKEASIIYFAVKGLINQQIDEASKGLTGILKTDPNNRLVMFLAINMMMKNSQSEEAYKLVQHLDANNLGLTLPYIEYLRGEILMQKNQYDAAIAAYQKFIRIYKADSFKKDAHLKIALSYFLAGKLPEANTYWTKAQQTGKVKYDPDISAQAFLNDGPFPNEKILKARLYTDGGYFKEAKAMIQAIAPSDLKTYKQQVEYYYRKARLAHKTNDIGAAKLFYSQTIDMVKDNPWYFGANSALQLGYIHQAGGDLKGAREYFEKTLSYRKHEYKNSIDSKAKSAMETLPKAK